MAHREYSANAQIEDDLESLDESSQSPSFYLPGFFNILKRKIFLIVGLVSVAVAAGVSLSVTRKETYQGNFYLLVEPISSVGKFTNSSTIARGDGVPNEDFYSLDYPTNLAFLKSPGMSARIAQEISRKDPSQSFAKVWADLRENLIVSRLGETARSETKIFEVLYKGDDPILVKKVLDITAETFIRYSEEDRRTSIKAGVKFIEKQLPSLEKTLTNLQRKQQTIREANNLINPETQGNELSTSLGVINQRIVETQIDLDGEKIRYNQLTKQLKFSSPQQALAASNISEDAIYNSQLKELEDIKTKLAIASADLTDDNPEIKSLKEKQQNLKALLLEREKRTLKQNNNSVKDNAGLLNFQGTIRTNLIGQLIESSNKKKVFQNTLERLQKEKINLEQQIKRIPSIIHKYDELTTQIGINRQVLNKLLVQRETLQVEGSQDLPWQIISKPQIPLGADGQPIGERSSLKKILPLALLGGLGLGIILAVAIEKYQNIFHTSDDIKGILKLPLIGEIPKIPSENSKEIDRVFWKRAFEYLYANLSSLYREVGVRSCVVCSIDAEENQEKIVLQLAKTAVATGKKVLLVDAHFDNSQLSSQLNLNNRLGLSNLLAEEINLTEAIQRPSDYSNLDFISSGSSLSQSENLLLSSKMKQLMREFRIRYDLVIYSPSSFYKSSEISSIISNTDGVLLIVEVGITNESRVKSAVQQMRGLRLPILGIIATEIAAEKLKIPLISSSPAPSIPVNQNGLGNLEQNLTSLDRHK